MADPAHIALFVPSLRGGGAERIMVSLANGFAARGHRVDLVLTRAEGPYLADVSPAVRIVDLDRSRVLASLLPLARYLRRERPEAMLSSLNHANLIAIMARGLTRSQTRLVVSERNSLSSLGTGRNGQLLRRLMRWLYPKADCVIALTQAGVQELTNEIGLNPSRVYAIPNPVDAAHFQQLAKIRPDHPWLQPGQPPIVLAVGRLETQKDYPTLLEAFARMQTQHAARLVILGEGGQRSAIEQQAMQAGMADRVLLAGFQDNPFGWMAACAVYVMSSRYEGFPNSLVQAMACGANVVSTDCPTGPAEILENGKWGRLAPVGNADALAAALKNALEDASTPNGLLRLTDFHPLRIVSAYEKALLQ